MKRIIAILLALVLVAALAAGCGKGSSIAGKYNVQKIAGKPIQQYFEDELSQDDFGMTLEDYLSLLNISSLEEFMSMELKEDGTVTISVAGEDPSTGTWKEENGKLIVTVDGEDPVEMTVNGSEITMDQGDGESYTFVKQAAK